MISKTLAEWKAEVEKYASINYELYAASINNSHCSEAMRRNYCDAAKNNWDLKEVLTHIQKYGSAFSNKCKACCNNDYDHNNRLQKVFGKYRRWINVAIANGANAVTRNLRTNDFVPVSAHDRSKAYASNVTKLSKPPITEREQLSNLMSRRLQLSQFLGNTFGPVVLDYDY